MASLWLDRLGDLHESVERVRDAVSHDAADWRALALSAALDGERLSDRLRVAGRNGLADFVRRLSSMLHRATAASPDEASRLLDAASAVLEEVGA